MKKLLQLIALAGFGLFGLSAWGAEAWATAAQTSGGVGGSVGFDISLLGIVGKGGETTSSTPMDGRYTASVTQIALKSNADGDWTNASNWNSNNKDTYAIVLGTDAKILAISEKATFGTALFYNNTSAQNAYLFTFSSLTLDSRTLYPMYFVMIDKDATLSGYTVGEAFTAPSANATARYSMYKPNPSAQKLYANYSATTSANADYAPVLSYTLDNIVLSEDVASRTVSGTTGTWGDTTATGWNATVPATGFDAILTVSGVAELTMDEASAELAKLYVNPDDLDGEDTLKFKGTAKLTAEETEVKASTDVSEIESDLGAVTIASAKKLTIGKDTIFTLTANNGTLHIASGTADDHLTLTQTSSLLLNKLTIAAGATVQVDNAKGGNPKYQVSGEGASSVLILKNTTNTGVDPNSSFSNLTLQIPSGANKLWLNGGTVKTTDEGVGLDMNAEVQLEQGNLTIASLAGTGTLVADGGNRTVTITDGADAEFTGSFGAYKLVKQGTGTQTLSNTSADVFTGGVDVEAGTLKVTTATALGSGAVTVNENATLTLNTPADVTLANAFTGAGTISKTGSGALTLTDIAGFNGKVDLAVGVLVATSADLKVTTTVEGMEVKKVTDDEGVTTYTLGAPTPSSPILPPKDNPELSDPQAIVDAATSSTGISVAEGITVSQEYISADAETGDTIITIGETVVAVPKYYVVTAKEDGTGFNLALEETEVKPVIAEDVKITDDDGNEMIVEPIEVTATGFNLAIPTTIEDARLKYIFKGAVTPSKDESAWNAIGEPVTGDGKSKQFKYAGTDYKFFKVVVTD